MKHWSDTLTLGLAPKWTLRRMRARAAAEVITRNYDAASTGYRTQGWRRSGSDANAAVASGNPRLRDTARDVVRNNAYAEAALATIVDHAVGTGIVAKPYDTVPPGIRARATARWKAWAETTDCDADGRLDLAGIQKLVMRTVVESGEVLVRRRIRLPEDNLPIPLQLQVLEPDYLDPLKDGESFTADNGTVVRRVIQGVEFNALGHREGYWLLQDHPGSTFPGGRTSVSRRVPAEEILHIFRPGRPGQVRGVSWFAPVILRLKELDEFQDATLMKQKIAACLAVLTTDLDGTASALGGTDAAQPALDLLSPGMIASVAPGRQITVVDPPAVNEHTAYVNSELRAIAVGLGVTMEDLTGDYANMPFSAARMSRLRHWARVEDWRWRMLVPQFCDPIWRWAMEAGQIMGVGDIRLGAEWTCPPPPMIDPAAEGLAYQRNIRTGIQTLSEAIRERGYDPETLFREMADDWKRLDALGLVLDCDPRKMTQAGQAQSGPPMAEAEPTGLAAVAANGTGNGSRG